MKRYFIMVAMLASVTATDLSSAAPKNFFVPDRFEQFHTTPDGTRYLADFAGMATEGDHTTIWLRRIEAESPGNKHQVEYATEFQYKISCSSDKVTLISYAVYRSNGELLESQTVNSESTIVPDTYLESLVNIACGKPPSGKEKHITFCTSDHVPPHVFESYRDKRLYSGVEVMKNQKGEIGGFVIKPAIMDSPITYLDCNGKFIALFHIFSSMKAKSDASKIIDPFSKAFPVREMLDFTKKPEAKGNL